MIALLSMSEILDGLFGLIKDFILFVIQRFFTLGDGILAGILDLVNYAMPANTNIDAVSDILQGINYFFPLSETLAFTYLLVLMWTSIWSFRTARTFWP